MGTDFVIIHNYPNHYKHLLFKALANNGCSFEVLFTAGSSGDRIERPLPDNDEYRYRTGFDGPYESVPFGLAAKFVWRSLSQLSPKVLIISGYYDAAAWAALSWSRVHRVPRILWAESNEFDRPRHYLKELPKRIFVKNCDLAHVYGVSSASYIQKLGMPTQSIYVKRAVADTNRFQKSKEIPQPSTGPKHLLYVGRFAPEKNLEFLLQAFSDFQQDPDNPQILLSLIGYGPLENELRAVQRKLRLQKTVSFPGKALQAELPKIYRSADALVIPSVYEPWGLVANEAMICGLPVLFSTQCGCAADLCNPKTGWSFSPWDKTALTRLIEMLASIPRERLRTMGMEASRLSGLYTPENCADVVTQTIYRAFARQSVPPERHRR